MSESYDVKVYMEESAWLSLRPTQEICEFTDLEEAVDEAKLWPEAYQVVVVSRGESQAGESGEYVFELNDIG